MSRLLAACCLILVAAVGRSRAEAPTFDQPASLPGAGSAGTHQDSLARLGYPRAAGVDAHEGVKRGTAIDGRWTILPPPSSRYGHVSVVDAERGRLLVIGGFDGGFPTIDEVWSFDLVTRRGWTRIEISGEHPPLRHQASAVVDPVGRRVIVHGGFVDLDTPLGDTWALDLEPALRWSRIDAAGAPPPRIGHSAVYDPVRRRMLMFGGMLAGEFTDEVWALSLDADPQWRLLSTAGDRRPAPRMQHTTTYDPQHDRVILHGGAASDFLGDTWALALAEPPTWSEIRPKGELPAARRHHRAAYDPIGRRMVIAGGEPVADAWQLSLAADPEWRRIPVEGENPDPRWAASLSYDAAGKRLLMFGGLGLARSMFNDLWSLELSDDPRWSLLAAPGPPGSLADAAAFVDPAADRMLLLGDFSGPAGDVGADDAWVTPLGDGRKWGRLDIGFNPFRANLRTGVVRDPLGGRLIALDGMNGFVPFLTLQSFGLPFDGPAAVGDWERVVQTRAGPTGRSRHMTVFDPTRNRVLVHGGLGQYNDSDFGDMWELRLDGLPVWTRLAPVGDVPAKRFDHQAVFDAARGRILVLGGGYAVGSDWQFGPDVWEVSLDESPVWTRLQPEGPAPDIFDPDTQVILDTRRDRVLVFGYDFRAQWNELWELTLAPTLRWRRLEMDGDTPASRNGPALAIDPSRDRLSVYMARTGQAYQAEWSDPATMKGPRPASVPAMAAARGGAGVSGALRLERPSVPGVLAAEIRPPAAGEVSFEVFDIGGRRVAHQSLTVGAGSVRWRTSGLAPGVYLVRLRQGQAISIGRAAVL